MDYKKLKSEITLKYLGIRQFFEKEKKFIGLDEGGFYQAVRNDSLKIKVLERISDKLGKPVSFWWPEENNKVNDSGENHHAYLQERIQDLKNERDDLRKHVALLEEKLETYEGKKKANG